jgi:hypothetical protein
MNIFEIAIALFFIIAMIASAAIYVAIGLDMMIGSERMSKITDSIASAVFFIMGVGLATVIIISCAVCLLSS